MATVETVPQEQRFVLSGVTWSTYEHLLQAFEGRHIRLTYHRGSLEIMTVSPAHERAKKILARLLEALTEELNIPICGIGNTTFRREDAERGLEPDECLYIEHEAAMRQKREIDLTVDPPPDLVLEIEISRSALDRMDVYAGLKVPEVWRYDGERLRVLVLQTDGRYIESENSPTFPQLPIDELTRFLNQREQLDDTTLVRSFRDWVRKNLAGESENSPT